MPSRIPTLSSSSSSSSAAAMHQNRCHDCSRKKSFQTTTMHLLLLSSFFLLVDFHHPSYNHYAGAFVIRKHSVVIRQRQEQQTTTCDGHDVYNFGRSGRNMNSCTSRNTILFDSVVADQEQEQIVAVARVQDDLDSSNSIASMATNEATSTPPKTSSSSSTSQIEVIMTNNGTSNGVTATASKAVATMTTDDKATLLGQMKKKSVENGDVDVPHPTANGGYSHTTSSRAKISAANKGKTPWNKGKPRSPEVKARIAAGVRAKNRQVFLKKLEDMGLTEEVYEAQKKEQLRIKDADRESRKTPNGGYRPTEETKKKISRILKEKHAKGEVKPRSKADPNKIRKGFTHSEETRKKISDSLRKRWQDDEGFQKKMKQSFNSRQDVRKRISESLKKKWQDPEFRNGMMEKISQRKSGKDAMDYDKDHRKKISEAMKRKWQDASYREKTLSSIKKSAQTRKVTTSPRKSRASTTAKSKTKTKARGLEELKPMTATDISKRKTVKKRVTRKRASTAKVDKNDDVTVVTAVRKPKSQPNKVKGVTLSTATSSSINLSSEDEIPVEKEKKKKNKKKKKEKDGSVTRLREERRDLFDLLYGDDDGDDEDGDVGNLLSESSSDPLDTLLGDEDLDSFDPYGLDDY